MNNGSRYSDARPFQVNRGKSAEMATDMMTEEWI